MEEEEEDFYILDKEEKKRKKYPQTDEKLCEKGGERKRERRKSLIFLPLLPALHTPSRVGCVCMLDERRYTALSVWLGTKRLASTEGKGANERVGWSDARDAYPLLFLFSTLLALLSLSRQQELDRASLPSRTSTKNKSKSQKPPSLSSSSSSSLRRISFFFFTTSFFSYCPRVLVIKQKQNHKQILEIGLPMLYYRSTSSDFS